MKPLSPRECQVIELLVQGWTQKEIACQLGVTRKTISSTLNHAKMKSGRSTVLSAVIYLIIQGHVLVNSA